MIALTTEWQHEEEDRSPIFVAPEQRFRTSTIKVKIDNNQEGRK